MEGLKKKIRWLGKVRFAINEHNIILIMLLYIIELQF